MLSYYFWLLECYFSDRAGKSSMKWVPSGGEIMNEYNLSKIQFSIVCILWIQYLWEEFILRK